MRLGRITPLLALLPMAACGDERPADAIPAESLLSRSLAGLPVMPGTQLTEVSGQDDAAGAGLRIPSPPDSVAAWYRRVLLSRHWTIVSDVRTADNTVTLHATDPTQRPIWLIIARDDAGPGAVVTMVGAVPAAGRDSLKQ